ncbi:phosphatidylinositol N-acetylglucosaminyltransferase subunit Y [Ornithorhynchus anatinus]|uniref:Phosphatidylinositol glycan anchor biosynthesis class Y n=1 Tax=Ornithorhynchus anatinus TaxID=9258 RepID=A0A6I8NT49_ORNAN|nr:phosphatidylinositol N-acetylglucosaminyltransferase subunit Y [Ornithorhynchus anatinus]
MALSLPALTVLVPLLSLAGLLGSARLDPAFPRSCAGAAGLCFYSLLLPLVGPVFVFFRLWAWMGIKLFRHN